MRLPSVLYVSQIGWMSFSGDDNDGIIGLG